jgi:hypothetical protein
MASLFIGAAIGPFVSSLILKVGTVSFLKEKDLKLTTLFL